MESTSGVELDTSVRIFISLIIFLNNFILRPVAFRCILPFYVLCCREKRFCNFWSILPQFQLCSLYLLASSLEIDCYKKYLFETAAVIVYVYALPLISNLFFRIFPLFTSIFLSQFFLYYSLILS